MSDAVAARLILLCVREEGSRSDAAVRQAAAAIGDWRRVGELASAHGVTAYVRGALAQVGFAPAAEDDAFLRDLELGCVADTLLLDVTLGRVLGAFHERRIAAIVLKGPVLARRIYPQPWLRPYQDVDLVVRGAEVARAAAVLLESGFVEIPYAAEEARRALPDSGAEGQFHRLFLSARGGALVELHADPLQLGLQPVAEAERWRRAIAIPELGPGALALGDDDNLLQLCVHVHRHGFSRIIWLKDLDLFVRRRGASLDWRVIGDVAGREGVRSSLWYALSLASELLGTPGTPAEQMAPAVPIRALYERLWPRKSVAALDGTMRRRAVQFHVAESWRGMLPTLVLMGRRAERLRVFARSGRRRFTEAHPSPNGRRTG